MIKTPDQNNKITLYRRNVGQKALLLVVIVPNALPTPSLYGSAQVAPSWRYFIYYLRLKLNTVPPDVC
jgi:hypothetical protein